jgi:hypothetical protein
VEPRPAGRTPLPQPAQGQNQHGKPKSQKEKTTRFHSNQKPPEGTGEKGLHSLRITVQVFKNSWEISKPRRGEGGRKKKNQKKQREGATGIMDGWERVTDL